MVHSEGARRLIALFAVMAGIGAQSVVTSPVEANKSSELQTYGVRLLGSELAAPVWSAQQRPLVLPPQAAEPRSSAAAILLTNAPSEARTAATLTERRPLAVPSELMKTTIERSWPEHREASGAPIELTENDVLIPARMPY